MTSFLGFINKTLENRGNLRGGDGYKWGRSYETEYNKETDVLKLYHYGTCILQFDTINKKPLYWYAEGVSDTQSINCVLGWNFGYVFSLYYNHYFIYRNSKTLYNNNMKPLKETHKSITAEYNQANFDKMKELLDDYIDEVKDNEVFFDSDKGFRYLLKYKPRKHQWFIEKNKPTIYNKLVRITRKLALFKALSNQNSYKQYRDFKHLIGFFNAFSDNVEIEQNNTKYKIEKQAKNRFILTSTGFINIEPRFLTKRQKESFLIGLNWYCGYNTEDSLIKYISTFLGVVHNTPITIDLEYIKEETYQHNWKDTIKVKSIYDKCRYVEAYKTDDGYKIMWNNKIYDSEEYNIDAIFKYDKTRIIKPIMAEKYYKLIVEQIKRYKTKIKTLDLNYDITMESDKVLITNKYGLFSVSLKTASMKKINPETGTSKYICVGGHLNEGTAHKYKDRLFNEILSKIHAIVYESKIDSIYLNQIKGCV